MKKDKEWLEKQINKTLNIDGGSGERIEGFNKGLEFSLDLIEELDEPELPVIPQFVADWIEHIKEKKPWLTLSGAFNHSTQQAVGKTKDWILIGNSDLFARAWLDGYTIEKEPDKLYEVKLPTENAMGNTMNLVQGGSKNRVWFDSLDDRIVKFKFTEKEIKSIDERYWAFREEVENV